jgi:flagellar assembly factor FliW
VLRIETKAFGVLEYQAADLIEFPSGLVGFENHRRFLAIDRPQTKPLVFLQSIDQPDLFFVTIPPALVEPGYRLQLLDEHLAALGLSETVSAELLVLSVVCLPENGPATANLLGPLVIHCPTGKGVQAVRDDRRYSAVHPIAFEETPCS